MKFIKKPEVVDAIQFIGENYNEVEVFLGDDYSSELWPCTIPIKTLKWYSYVKRKDWIVKKVN